MLHKKSGIHAHQCDKGWHFVLYAIFDTGQKISVLRLRAGGKNFMEGCLRWFLCDFIEDLGALRTLTLFRIVLWSQKRTTYSVY